MSCHIHSIPPFSVQEGKPSNILIASIDDLLGDKLTAFAPNTTGIPYKRKGNSMSMEIIKQLYDIGYLFENLDSLTIVHKTFLSVCKTELGYRNLEIDYVDVLDDIYQTALCMTSRGLDGYGDYEALSDGIKRIGPYIFSESYYLEKAIAHASKAAYLSQLVLKEAKDFEKFEDPLQIADWSLSDRKLSMKIDKLKKSNPEAFFYWYKSILID